jgi:hypothetical protein
MQVIRIKIRMMLVNNVVRNMKKMFVILVIICNYTLLHADNIKIELAAKENTVKPGEYIELTYIFKNDSNIDYYFLNPVVRDLFSGIYYTDMRNEKLEYIADAQWEPKFTKTIDDFLYLKRHSEKRIIYKIYVEFGEKIVSNIKYYGYFLKIKETKIAKDLVYYDYVFLGNQTEIVIRGLYATTDEDNLTAEKIGLKNFFHPSSILISNGIDIKIVN